jgi:GT2 family glycosyltransferase
VESVRRNTDVPYELVIVDNGSEWAAANYARLAADRVVMNQTNEGFARGMNQGLDVARAKYVAFCNNDTVLPPGWASTLLETARANERCAIVVPALTDARNPVNVREGPGEKIVTLPPFSAPPAAVVYVMPADVVRGLGAWGEEYEIASGEDVDLCFKVWVNDLDILFDERVLVEHIGKGSASRLDDWQELWARNRRRFLEKWQGDASVPNLGRCDPERFARNRAIAAAVAEWMEKYFRARDDPRGSRFARRTGQLARGARTRLKDAARPGWRKIRPHLPPSVVRMVRKVGG